VLAAATVAAPLKLSISISKIPVVGRINQSIGRPPASL